MNKRSKRITKHHLKMASPQMRGQFDSSSKPIIYIPELIKAVDVDIKSKKDSKPTTNMSKHYVKGQKEWYIM